MYNKVFISHCKDDPNLDFFHKVFSGINTSSVWMEFEEISAPPYQEIIRKVNESEAVWVLLSSYLLERPYTNNWVSFEVGLAANRPKPTLPLFAPKIGTEIYVFEPLHTRIDFPVPYFNYYMPYEGNPEELRYLQKVIDAAPYHGDAGIPLRCPYYECAIEFKLLKDVKQFVCPACRRGIERVPLRTEGT